MVPSASSHDSLCANHGYTIKPFNPAFGLLTIVNYVSDQPESIWMGSKLAESSIPIASIQ